MINRFRYRETTWVDMIHPTLDEIRMIAQEFKVNPIVAAELHSPSFKSRVDLYENYIYLILHFPAFKHSHKHEDMRQEVDFIIGKDFLITARYDTIDPIEKFAKIVEVNSILDRENERSHAGFLFFGILKEIYKSLSDELEYTENWIAKIESAIFKGKEKEMVVSLSHVTKNLLNFKRATDFHKDVLESLEQGGKKVFDEHFSHHVKRAIDEYYKVKHAINANLESAGELRETNNSLVSTKQNEIMKTLTLMAFVTFPLTLLAAIFSMETKDTPILGLHNDFWIIISIMLIAMSSMFAFFKHKKWL